MVVRKRLELTGPAMVFVTTTVKDWIPVFADNDLAMLFLSVLSETISRHAISLSGYVLMPSHFHALMGFKRIEQLSEVIQEIKSISSRRIKPLLSRESMRNFINNGEFQFWKPRFDDLIIWSEKQFRIKMKYIHNNPVKGRLVNDSKDYLYSSAKDWNSSELGILPIDKEWNWQEAEVK